MTNIETQIAILADFYINYKGDKQLKDFMEFNDLGLPLAYLTSEGLCEPTEIAVAYIEETFSILLATMGVEDIGFESLEHLLSTAENAGGTEQHP